MQYEPIKKTLGSFFGGPLFIRKIFYILLDILLLRAWHIKKALRNIEFQIPNKATVLDAGSGFGQYSWRMCKMYRDWKIDSVDINRKQIEDCNRFFTLTGLSHRVRFRETDLTLLNNPGVYDLILSVDVMEHIKDDVLVFKNFYNSLKNNGKLIISTPSDKGGSDVHNDEDKSFIDEHVRDGYSIEDISEKLLKAGFHDIRAQYTYGKPGNLSWKLSMKYPIKLINASYLFFILIPFYYLIFFPVSLILNSIDLHLTHKTGTGLLVTASKVKS
jgi:SAM-dependent methyltransferase